MDIYYRGFESQSPISSAAKHVSAFAARLVLSVLRSVSYLDDATFAALEKVLTLNNLWACMLIFAGWMLASIIGGPVGAAVNALLLYFGIQELYDRIGEIYHPLKDWLQGSYDATKDDELEAPAKSFATGLANGAITVLEFVILHKLFKATESALTKRLPPPAWLEAVWKRTMGERARTRRAKPDKKANDKSQAVTTIAGTLQAQGVKAAANKAGSASVGPLVAVGVGVVTVVTLTTIAVVSAGRDKR